ncbi:MAG: DUF421 domain-containing protein [Candidatus Coprovivens sp.]
MFDTIFRTVFFYFFIVFAYRIMGKREVGQLGIIDLIVSILIAELVALSIEKTNQSIWLAIAPIAVLVVLEIVLGYLSVKLRIVNKVFGGKPTVIINDGKIVYKNLVSQRYSIDDLLLELRKKGISSIEEVEYALLETNGELSIFKYKPFKLKSNLPLPIIVEGVVQKDTLKYINKSYKWLEDVLIRNNISLDNIFYALFKNNHIYIIRKS